LRDITKVRKLATAAAVSLVLSSGGVRALGLGDIEMRSALNQPMNAEIRLTSVQPGEAGGMIVKLASPDAFARAGIDRTAALTDLRFSVDEGGGAPVIRISSSRPVVEPFLNFLVEVDWPTGRMVREYTVLLDPPVFMTPSASDSTSASEQPATSQRSDSSLLTPTPIERTASSDGVEIEGFESDGFEVELVGSDVEVGNDAGALSSGGEVVSLENLGGDSTVELIEGDAVALTDLTVENTDARAQFQADQNFEFDVEIVGTSTEVSDTFVAGDQGALDSEVVSLESLDTGLDTGVVIGGGGEVTVQRGDTLGSIAETVSVPGVSSQQMMMALLNANKNAFINGNVNLVKAGAILRIPEGDELAQLTQAQAVAQMGEQNQLWREYRDNVRSSAGTRLAEAPKQQDTAPETDATGSDAATDAATNNEELPALSAEAQKILDEAKEAANRKELSIIAGAESTTTAASATADNNEASVTAQLGEINKKLALAKEELASTRLESDDLVEQSDDLQSTAENMESLVDIRQSEVARLEEALRAATEQAEAEKIAAAEAAEAERVAAAQAEADRLAAVEAEKAAQLEAEKLAEAEQVTEQAVVDTDATGEVATNAQTATAESEPVNALTSNGETLESVELVGDSTEPVAAVVEANPATGNPATGETTPFYMELLQKYGKWVVAGIGGLSALLLGVLLIGKRRRKAADEMLDHGDEVEFLDSEDDDVQIHTETETVPASTDVDPAVAAAAGAVATGAAASAADGIATAADTQSEVDEPASLTAQTDVLDNTSGPDGLDPDDTISEVDVYLAYGLHGQAEELLSKAIDRDPTNHEYAMKLLQTQHAQGNAEAFAQGATSYHQSFGGDKAPNWDAICNMGHDLQPNNAMFSSSAVAVESIGKSGDAASTMAADDFSTDDSDTIGSVSRDFGDAAQPAVDVEESDLMDQSLDPAFAFDETDLEATGDFSQMANDIAAEEELAEANADTALRSPELDDNSLDFPDFNADDSIGELADVGQDKLSSVGSAINAGVGGAAAAATGGLAAAASTAKDSATDVFDDALSLDDLDSAASAANDGAQGSVAEDLTLDLDQLSGDLEMGGADLLDQTSAGSLSDLDISDLSGDNELLGDNVSSIDGSDEMDTMMDLAKAYIDMGDKDSASSALGEIVKSGNPAQVSEAETLLRKIS